MLTTLFPSSAVVDADDAGLRQLTHERLKVLAQFTADNCSICLALAPSFAGFAENSAYEGILFLRLDSNENPVAKHLMAERAAPFFVSYSQGRILECDTCTTVVDVRAQLDRLRAWQPQTA